MSSAPPPLDIAYAAHPRRAIATFDSYPGAQAAVDRLSDSGFPVENVAIVGSDLRLVETVTGRLTTQRAALAGAGTGAWFGLFIGLIFGFTTPYVIAPIILAVVLGAIFGAVYGAVAHASTGGRRDFSSQQSLVASRYDVLVDEPHFDRARELLGTAAPAR